MQDEESKDREFTHVHYSVCIQLQLHIQLEFPEVAIPPQIRPPLNSCTVVWKDQAKEVHKVRAYAAVYQLVYQHVPRWFDPFITHSYGHSTPAPHSLVS
jgi:hypothetical protein